MMSKAEVESLSSYNSEVEEKQARHIDNEVILMFLLGIINVNILTIFMFFFYDECGNAGDNGKLEDDNYVVNKVFKVTMMIINMLT